MANLTKLSIQIPASIVGRISYQADRHGLTGSQMITSLCQLGLAVLEEADTKSYLAYLARKTAKSKKVVKT